MSPLRCAGPLWCCLTLCGACSGEAFRLVDAQLQNEPDGGLALPPLMTTTSNEAGAAGAAGVSPGAPDPPDADVPDVVVTPPPPVIGPCGVLRSDTLLANTEICVPAGTFSMGSVGSVPSGYAAHGPVHEVTLAGFALDAYEVTVVRYRACVSAGICSAPSTTAEQGCTFTTAPGARERHPVTCLSWTAARDFCAWDEGRRLPTEAEWERAARGTAGSVYAWGDSFECSIAVLAGATSCPAHSGSTPRSVGSTPAGASEEGAFDLTGNAWEWVADWFGPYGSAAATNPTGPTSGASRIQRGGNWQTSPPDAAAYMRRPETPAAETPSSFRCARTVLP